MIKTITLLFITVLTVNANTKEIFKDSIEIEKTSNENLPKGYQKLFDTEITGAVYYLQNGIYLLGEDANTTPDRRIFTKWRAKKPIALQYFTEYCEKHNLKIIAITSTYKGIISTGLEEYESGILVITEPKYNNNLPAEQNQNNPYEY